MNAFLLATALWLWCLPALAAWTLLHAAAAKGDMGLLESLVADGADVEAKCEHHERTVGRDNCVSFEGRQLQLPAHTHRRHFIKVPVRVHRYPDGRLGVFHGPRRLADYGPDGSLVADAPTAGDERGPRRAAAR